MKLDLPLRLAASGLVGLAALSASQWLRENVTAPGPALAFSLGVMPNLAAAFAMPLIVASFMPQAASMPATRSSRRAYALILSLTTLGLVGWEFVQTQSAAFVFDVYDLVATAAGSLLALLVFFLRTKPAAAEAHDAALRR
jgi:hypothetical protein